MRGVRSTGADIVPGAGQPMIGSDGLPLQIPRDASASTNTAGTAPHERSTSISISISESDESESLNDGETSVIAGAFRNVLNRILRMFSRDHSNRLLSKKMLTKVISKSQIHDVSEHYSAIKTEAREYYNKSSRFTSFLKAVGYATVYITKSIVLGGAVFTMYEQAWHSLQSLFPIDSGYDSYNSKISHGGVSLEYIINVLYPSILSTLSGACAGASHGALYCMMKRFIDQPLSQYKTQVQSSRIRGTHKLPKLPTTMISHALVYSTLFGVYDFSKQNTLFALEYHDIMLHNQHSKEMEGIVSVIIGATFAGLSSEIVNSVTHPMETKDARTVFVRRWTTVSPQYQDTESKFRWQGRFRSGYFRGLMPTIASTIAGFLAYEYAKQLVDDFAS